MSSMVLALEFAQAQQPQPAWIQLYNGPANSSDKTRALTIDHSGNVLVTGYSRRENGSFEYATVKYSNTGLPLWTNQFSNPGKDYGLPRAVAVDKSNNVFVTSESVILKYSSAGLPLWTNYNDAGTIAFSADGNMIVAATSAGNFTDYVTVKYSPMGDVLWTNRYNGPVGQGDAVTALALDASGNVFVTGYSADSAYFPENIDFATIKYSSTGVPLWTNRFAGSANNSDIPYGMAVDSAGDVIITGATWNNAAGNDYVTIKYAGNGVPLWTNTYDGVGSHDYPTAVVVSSNGTAFATGFSYDLTGFSHFATVAYSSMGTPLWTNRYHGAKEGYASASALALRDEAVIVAGVVNDVLGASEYVTIGYTLAGVPAWTNRLGGATTAFARPKVAKAEEAPSARIAMTSDGYVIIGFVSNTLTGNDYFIARYTNPVSLNATLVSSGVQVQWPSTHLGWRLEMNTSVLSNTWTTLTGSTLTNRMTVPQSGSPTFYRLTFP